MPQTTINAQNLNIRVFNDRTRKDGDVTPAHVTISGDEGSDNTAFTVRVTQSAFDEAFSRFIDGYVGELRREVKSELKAHLETLKGNLVTMIDNSKQFDIMANDPPVTPEEVNEAMHEHYENLVNTTE